MNSHGHGKSTLFRISTSERHPGNVQWMGEGAEDLGPDNTKVSDISVGNLGKDSVENVTDDVARQPGHNRVTSAVAGIRREQVG